jgi:hypothetical protein
MAGLRGGIMLKNVSEPLINYLKFHVLPHRKYCVCNTEPNRLILYREIVAVYCDSHTEHTHTLCGQNAEF